MRTCAFNDGPAFCTPSSLYSHTGVASYPAPAARPSNLAADAVAVAVQLLARHGLVAGIGHVTSGPSLAAWHVSNDAQMVQRSPTATAVLYSQVGPFSSRMVRPDDAQGRLRAEVLARDYPADARLVLTDVHDDDSRGWRANVRAALDSMCFPLVLDRPHSEDGVRPEAWLRTPFEGREYLARVGRLLT